MRYRLLIEYDGTDFCGWQVQDNGTSIQTILATALQTLLKHPPRLIGSGRTDAGVHARGQVAHFTAESQIEDTRKFLHSLNGLIPFSIRVLALEAAEETFHAQFSASGKIYHYYIGTRPSQSCFRRAFQTHVPKPLDLAAIREAICHLVGTHDFTSFANQAHEGSAARNPVRTIRRIDLIKEEDGFRLEFEGSGFLYKMVRNLTGALLEVGKGKLPASHIPAILAARDRKRAPQAAPAKGLFLMQVFYDKVTE